MWYLYQGQKLTFYQLVPSLQQYSTGGQKEMCSTRDLCRDWWKNIDLNKQDIPALSYFTCQINTGKSKGIIKAYAEREAIKNIQMRSVKHVLTTMDLFKEKISQKQHQHHLFKLEVLVLIENGQTESGPDIDNLWPLRWRVELREGTNRWGKNMARMNRVTSLRGKKKKIRRIEFLQAFPWQPQTSRNQNFQKETTEM